MARKAAPVAQYPAADLPAEFLRAAIVALVTGERLNLTTCQLAVFLTCYLDDGPHTVRGLATALQVGSSGISRAIEALIERGLACHGSKGGDGRSNVVTTTPEGTKFLRELRAAMRNAIGGHPCD